MIRRPVLACSHSPVWRLSLRFGDDRVSTTSAREPAQRAHRRLWCGPRPDHRRTTAEPVRSVDLPYADVAGDYAKASGDLARGRDVVDRLVAGDIASVYGRSSPQVKAQASPTPEIGNHHAAAADQRYAGKPRIRVGPDEEGTSPP